MKYLGIITILLLSFTTTQSQNINLKSSQSSNVNKTIPPFKIQLANGTGFTSKNLKTNEQLLLVYFSPDCEHCKTFTGNLLKNIHQFKNTQIVMVSYLPVAEIKKFASEFKLDKYPAVKVGTEGYSFIVQRWYKVQHFPFTAIFNKKGMLIASYREAPSINELVQKFKIK